MNEATGDHSGAITDAVERGNGLAGAGGQLNLAGYLINDGSIQAGQNGHALAQGLLKIQFAAHSPGRDSGNLLLLAGVRGQHLDDLALNEGAVAVEADEALGAPAQTRRLDGNIDANLLCELCQRLAYGCRGTIEGQEKLQPGQRRGGKPADAIDIGIKVSQYAGDLLYVVSGYLRSHEDHRMRGASSRARFLLPHVHGYLLPVDAQGIAQPLCNLLGTRTGNAGMGSEGDTAGKDGLFDVDKRGAIRRQHAEEGSRDPGLVRPSGGNDGIGISLGTHAAHYRT